MTPRFAVAVGLVLGCSRSDPPPTAPPDPQPEPKPQPARSRIPVVAASVIAGMARLEGARNAAYIDKREVSVADFKRCVNAGQCAPPSSAPPCDGLVNNWLNQRGEHPVNCVDVSEAARYCVSLGKRLPSEGELNAAAPVGKPTCKTAVLAGCGDSGTSPVGSKPAGTSAVGVEDAIGNVAEIIGVSPGYDIDLTLLSGARHEFVFGGSYATKADSVELGRPQRTESLYIPSPEVGFRCASSPPGREQRAMF